MQWRCRVLLCRWTHSQRHRAKLHGQWEKRCCPYAACCPYSRLSACNCTALICSIVRFDVHFSKDDCFAELCRGCIPFERVFWRPRYLHGWPFRVSNLVVFIEIRTCPYLYCSTLIIAIIRRDKTFVIGFIYALYAQNLMSGHPPVKCNRFVKAESFWFDMTRLLSKVFKGGSLPYC